MIISFIGNCQSVALCILLQRLLRRKPYLVVWLLYGDEFKEHDWSLKCMNSITDYEASLEKITISDVIIFQEINKKKSSFSNEETLQQIKKSSCTLIKFPSIFFHYDCYDKSLIELQNRETINNVTIQVSQIINKYKTKILMHTYNHPNIFLYLEILKEICTLLNIDFFTKEEYSKLIDNKVDIGLPG